MDIKLAFLQLSQAIPQLRGLTRIEQITKGYSSDGKYALYVEDRGDTPQYLLRTYSLDRVEEKQKEFHILKRLQELKVRCSEPVEIGKLADQQLGYMLLTYIEGEEASVALPQLSEKEQFTLGVEAGHELHKMHQLIPEEDIQPWHERAEAKHARYRKEYAECGVRIPNEFSLLNFLDNNLDAMKNRPNCFQHDDFHISNLILNNKSFAGVIDFNRYDWGDPIHEYVKVGMFSSEISVPFSLGQIYGYHQGQQPKAEFWKLYSLYLGMTLISSVVWILRVKPEELEIMMSKINRVMEDHKHFTEMVPGWYKPELIDELNRDLKLEQGGLQL